MKTEAIIRLDDLMGASMEMSSDVAAVAVRRLKEIEPYLAGFLETELVALAGMMTLGGAPQPMVRQLHDRILSIVLIVFDAQRKATIRLWRETHANTPLAQLELLESESTSPEEES